MDKLKALLAVSEFGDSIAGNYVLVVPDTNRTILMASDGIGIMLLNFPGIISDRPIKFEAYAFAKSVKAKPKARGIELLSDRIVVKTRAESRYVELEKLETIPNINYISRYNKPILRVEASELVRVYNTVAFNSSYNNCKIVFGDRIFMLRNGTSEMRTNSDVFVNEPIAVDFKSFAHFVNAIKRLEYNGVFDVHIRSGEVAFISDDMVSVLACEETQIMKLTDRFYNVGKIQLKPRRLKIKYKYHTVCVDDLEFPVPIMLGSKKFELSEYKVRQLIKRYGQEYELFVIANFAILKSDKVTVALIEII